jgi:hypothetical protein
MALGMIEIIGEDMDINYWHGQRKSRVTRMNDEKELNMTWTDDIARHVVKRRMMQQSNRLISRISILMDTWIQR